MRQVDVILAKFPGPVTLYVSRRRRLVGLAFSLAVTAIFAWIWIADADTPSRGLYDGIMLPVTILLFGGLAIRAVILLLWPGSASLTLDANGFEIGQVFRHIRLPWLPWRGVSSFRVETTYWRARDWRPASADHV